MTRIPPSLKNTLSLHEKLKSRKILDALFLEGKSLTAGPVRLLFMEQIYAEDFPVRIAVSAPKRAMRHAHDRNRMKRLMREGYRLHKHPLLQYCHQQKIGLAILFISRCNTPLEYSVTQEKIILLLKLIIQEHAKTNR